MGGGAHPEADQFWDCVCICVCVSVCVCACFDLTSLALCDVVVTERLSYLCRAT